MDSFAWNTVSEEAAQLIAEGRLSLSEIAEKLDVDRKTLWNWRQAPEFTARVDEHLEAFRDEVLRRGIAVRERRVKALNDRWNRMQALIEARADKMAGVPGGSTGLLAHDVKGVGRGDDFELIDVYRFDAALVKEIREHEKQAAQELGQWTERIETKNETTHAVIPALAAALAKSYGDPSDSPNASNPAHDPGDADTV